MTEEDQMENEGQEETEGEEKRDRLGRVLHTVKCSDCGKDTQVPFEPQEGRPVYCRDCFQKHRPKRRF